MGLKNVFIYFDLNEFSSPFENQILTKIVEALVDHPDINVNVGAPVILNSSFNTNLKTIAIHV